MAGISLLVHHGILFNGFINFDDPHVVLGNINRMSSLGEELRKVAALPITAMPIRSLAFVLIVFAFGKDPVWFHGASLLVHTAAGVVLFLLIRQVLSHIGRFTREETRKNQVAFLTSLLFLIHPINCNAVAWATCLKENLCALFLFLSFLCYIRAEGRLRHWLLMYLGCAALFLLALGAKPTAVVLPAMLLVFSFCRLQGLQFLKRVQRLRYHVLTAGTFFILFVVFQYQWMARFVFEDQQGVYTRMLSIFYALFVYARNFLAPFWLNVRYPDVAITSMAQDIRVIVAMIGLSALLVFAIKRFRKDPLPLFALCWFLIFLAPTSGIVPISTNVADRYVYVAGVGLFLMGGYYLAPILARWAGRPVLKTIGISAMVVLVAGLGTLAFMRDRIWANDLTLWSDSLHKTPHNWVAHNNISHYYFLKKAFEKSIEHAEMSNRLNPYDPGPLRNVVTSALKAGDHEKAREAGLGVIGMIKNPSAMDYNQLGVAYQGLGDEKTAIAFLKKSLETNPDFVIGLENLTALYMKNGDLPEAYPYLKRLLKLRQGDGEVLEKIAPIAGKLGHYEAAQDYYERLNEQNPDDMKIRINLMALALQQSRYERAIDLAEQALKGLRREERARYFFIIKQYQVNGLIALGRRQEAVAALQEAQQYARKTNNIRELSNIQMAIERLMGPRD